MTAGFASLQAIVGGALLAGTIAYAIEFTKTLIHDPTSLLGRMLFGLGLGMAWLVFVLLG